MQIYAYAYDADLHCESCAEKRFKYVDGELQGEDSEGNEIAPCFYLEEVSGYCCGTCGEEFDDLFNFSTA